MRGRRAGARRAPRWQGHRRRAGERSSGPLGRPPRAGRGQARAPEVQGLDGWRRAGVAPRGGAQAAPRAWQHGRVTDQAKRFDAFASGYADYWAPVLAPAVGTLLDELEPLALEPERILDVGTGTGQLALAALERWPGATVVGIDVSSGMTAVAEAEAKRVLGRDGAKRFSIRLTPADELPFEDASFDLAISSFVYQLVERRARALREARRVLRPGGILAYVSWLEDDRAFRPEQVFDDILDDLDIEPRAFDGRPGDIPSVDRAAGELRRAGFADVTAHAGTIEHRFGV